MLPIKSPSSIPAPSERRIYVIARTVGAIVALLFASLVLLAFPPCAVSETAAVRTQAVHYGDLHLTRPADAHQLMQRITRAATNVCDLTPLDYLSASGKCRTRAIADAVRHVDAALLTSEWDQHPLQLASK